MLNSEAREVLDRTLEQLEDAANRGDQQDAARSLQVLLQIAGGDMDARKDVRAAVQRFRDTFVGNDNDRIDFPDPPTLGADRDTMEDFRSRIVLLFPDDPREGVLEQYFEVTAAVDRSRQPPPPKKKSEHRQPVQTPSGGRAKKTGGIPWKLVVAGAIGIGLYLLLRRLAG